MANAKITSVRLVATGSQGKVTRVRLTSVGANQGRVTRVRLQVIGPFRIDAGVAQTASPFEVVVLTGILSSGTADSWLWEQTSGTTVTLAPVDGDPSSVTFTAPATLGGATLGFRVTATSGGSPAVDVVTVTVNPHNGLWQYAGSTLIGRNTNS